MSDICTIFFTWSSSSLLVWIRQAKIWGSVWNIGLSRFMLTNMKERCKVLGPQCFPTFDQMSKHQLFLEKFFFSFFGWAENFSTPFIIEKGKETSKQDNKNFPL